MNEFIFLPPAGGNKLILSRLTDGTTIPATRCYEVGIKYVVAGTEYYTLNNVTHAVAANHYLLVNSDQYYDCRVPKSTRPIIGICCFLYPATLNEVYHSLASRPGDLLDNPAPVFQKAFDFLEGVYTKDENALGRYLETFARTVLLREDVTTLDTTQFFHDLAIELLIAQGHVQKKFMLIAAKENSTRKELYKRVLAGKTIIDECFLENLTIPEVAAKAALSESHFYRTFKQTFGISPYRYHMEKRLHYAVELITREYTIEQIAALCKFSDSAAFSKAFKKQYKLSPLRYRALLTGKR